MSKWEALLSGTITPGLYRLPPGAHAGAAERAVAPAGWRVFALDGERITDKMSFLEEVSQAMNFPSYFGRNWDAFEEMIRDLDWAPAKGYVILLPHAAAFVRTPDWPTVRSIFENAVHYWQTQGKPMYVLIGGTNEGIPHL